MYLILVQFDFPVLATNKGRPEDFIFSISVVKELSQYIRFHSQWPGLEDALILPAQSFFVVRSESLAAILSADLGLLVKFLLTVFLFRLPLRFC